MRRDLDKFKWHYRLCSIECSFSQPLAAAGPNRPFAADIEGWSMQRVRVGRLPVYYLMMLRENAWQRQRGAWQPSLAGGPLRQRFFETAAAAKMTHVSEGRSMDDFRAATLLPERHAAPPPAGCAGLPADRWFDFQDDEFQLARPGEWVRILPDPAASDGVAAQQPGNHNEWAVQLPLALTELTRRPGRKWRMAVAVRVDKTGEEGIAFTYGLMTMRRSKGSAAARSRPARSPALAMRFTKSAAMRRGPGARCGSRPPAIQPMSAASGWTGLC